MNEDVEVYGDPGIATRVEPVPRWLVWTYIILPILGIYLLIAYWNGSQGWLDRGYWFELQKAANTTYPHINMLSVEENK